MNRSLQIKHLICFCVCTLTAHLWNTDTKMYRTAGHTLSGLLFVSEYYKGLKHWTSSQTWADDKMCVQALYIMNTDYLLVIYCRVSAVYTGMSAHGYFIFFLISRGGWSQAFIFCHLFFNFKQCMVFCGAFIVLFTVLLDDTLGLACICCVLLVCLFWLIADKTD